MEFFGKLGIFPTNTGQDGGSPSSRIFPPQFGKQSQGLCDTEDTILFHCINMILNNEYKRKSCLRVIPVENALLHCPDYPSVFIWLLIVLQTFPPILE